MAKQRIANSWNIDPKCLGPASQYPHVFRMELLRHPPNILPKLLRHLANILASHLRKHCAVAIATDKLNRDVEVQQELERFTRHWPRKYVAAHHHLIHSRQPNIPEHSLKRGEIAVDIINCRNAHNRPPQNNLSSISSSMTFSLLRRTPPVSLSP